LFQRRSSSSTAVFRGLCADCALQHAGPESSRPPHLSSTPTVCFCPPHPSSRRGERLRTSHPRNLPLTIRPVLCPLRSFSRQEIHARWCVIPSPPHRRFAHPVPTIPGILPSTSSFLLAS
jgi:hypothetical protein